MGMSNAPPMASSLPANKVVGLIPSGLLENLSEAVPHALTHSNLDDYKTTLNVAPATRTTSKKVAENKPVGSDFDVRPAPDDCNQDQRSAAARNQDSRNDGDDPSGGQEPFQAKQSGRQTKQDTSHPLVIKSQARPACPAA